MKDDEERCKSCKRPLKAEDLQFYEQFRGTKMVTGWRLALLVVWLLWSTYAGLKLLAEVLRA